MDKRTIAFGLIWGALFLSPIIGLVMYRRNREKSAAASKTSVKIYISIIMLWLIFFVTPLSFAGVICSPALTALAYFSYCMLYFIGLRIKERATRNLILVLGIVPIAIGYILSTVGVIGLGPSISRSIPIRTIVHNDEYYTKLYGYGGAMSSHAGKIAEVNKHPLGIGFLEYTIISKPFDMNDYQYNPDSLTVEMTKDTTGSNVFNFSAEGKLLYSFKE